MATPALVILKESAKVGKEEVRKKFTIHSWRSGKFLKDKNKNKILSGLLDPKGHADPKYGTANSQVVDSVDSEWCNYSPDPTFQVIPDPYPILQKKLGQLKNVQFKVLRIWIQHDF